MDSQTIFEKYGGQETVNKLVDAFYVRMLADDNVKGFFEGVDMNKLKGHQQKFIAFAIGGPNNYEGRDMKTAHLGMGLNDSHYDSLVDNLSDAMDSLGVSEDDIVAVVAKVESLRNDVLGR